MIQKLRNILGVTTIDDKLIQFNNINEELSEIDSNIHELSIDYHKNKVSQDIINKSINNEEIISCVNGRCDLYRQGYINKVFALKKQRDVLLKERKNLLKDKNLLKAQNKIENFNKIKTAYKQGSLTKNLFNNIYKSIDKNKVVKYSDVIVFNEDNKILLLKRSNTDDTFKNDWVIPGGHVDYGETFLQTGIRELQEESGLFIPEIKEVGVYKTDEVEIHYFIGYINTEEQPIILEYKETQDYNWVESLTELDLYEFPFNMKDNIKKILDIPIENKKQLSDNIVKGEKIHGGLADNLTAKDIAERHNVSIDLIKQQLLEGIKVEYEHTNNTKEAKEIALDHLYEIPDYYTRLNKMENKKDNKEKKEDRFTYTSTLGLKVIKTSKQDNSKKQDKKRQKKL